MSGHAKRLLAHWSVTCLVRRPTGSFSWGPAPFLRFTFEWERLVNASRAMGVCFTLDDVKNNNLIFVGSPSENLSLLYIPGTRKFVFQRVASGPRQGDLSIVSKHPKPGESTAYLASPSGAVLTEDYSVVGLVPGIESGRYVMILAGTTTFGTEGAVELVCRRESVEKFTA